MFTVRMPAIPVFVNKHRRMLVLSAGMYKDTMCLGLNWNLGILHFEPDYLLPWLWMAVTFTLKDKHFPNTKLKNDYTSMSYNQIGQVI